MLLIGFRLANATAILGSRFDSQPSAAKCMICDLLVNLLHFFNDAVIGGSTEQAILDAIKKFCDATKLPLKDVV